ncbi:MAG: ABC transporter permease [Actinomycetota bacterium]
MPDVVRRWRWELILVGILIAVLVVNVSLSPFYLSVQNFINVFQLSIEKVIVAVIMTFVIVNGEIDLSVAAVMGLSASVLGALHAGGTLPFEVAIVIALMAAVAAGMVQGFFVAKLGLPSLVVTLAGLIGLRGVARILLEDRAAGDFPEWFDRLGQQPFVGRISFALLMFFVGIVVAGIVLHRTALGRSIFVIGNNPDVARYSGINVVRTKFLLMTSSALVAGLAGILFAARLGSVRANLAEGFELDIITMVLMGGVSIFGGTGSMVGVGLSIFIILNLRNGLGLARIAVSTQTGVIGALLILSVLVPNIVDRIARRRPLKDDSRSPPGSPTSDLKGGARSDSEASNTKQVVSMEGGTA